MGTLVPDPAFSDEEFATLVSMDVQEKETDSFFYDNAVMPFVFSSRSSFLTVVVFHD
jgi:hypothetical protein